MLTVHYGKPGSYRKPNYYSCNNHLQCVCTRGTTSPQWISHYYSPEHAYFSPWFPNRKNKRKVPLFTTLAQHGVTWRQRHHSKMSLCSDQSHAQFGLVCKTCFYFLCFVIHFLPFPLLTVLTEAACAAWNVPSLLSHPSRKGFSMKFLKGSYMTVSFPESMSRGKHTNFWPLKSVSYFCEPTWNSKGHWWVWKHSSTSAEVVGEAPCSEWYNGKGYSLAMGFGAQGVAHFTESDLAPVQAMRKSWWLKPVRSHTHLWAVAGFLCCLCHHKSEGLFLSTSSLCIPLGLLVPAAQPVHVTSLSLPLRSANPLQSLQPFTLLWLPWEEASFQQHSVQLWEYLRWDVLDAKILCRLKK